MIAVVTGGSGFIGRNLVHRLLTDGHEVRCLVHAGAGHVPLPARRFVVRYDDPASLLDCEALDRADVVFHLAGATKAVRAAAFMSANVTPTRHLLGALTARRLAPRFVYVSSQAASGPAESLTHPVDEDDPPRPVESYGRSKLEAERVVESFGDHVPVTIVRPCAVFGPHDRDFLLMFRTAARGILIYPGTATHWLSLIHVDDVVAGLICAARTPRAISRTYFLASADPVQWRSLGGEIAHAMGRRVRHLNLDRRIVGTASVAGDWLGRLTRRASVANRSKATLARHPYWVCSTARACTELGFRAERSLPDGIRDTYFWYRQQGWVHRSASTGIAVT
jgi:nucleoside-diphosphate-sugar epimerase